MTIKARLSQAQAVEDQKEKTEQYKKVLLELTAAASEADFEEYVDHSECPRLAVAHTAAWDPLSRRPRRTHNGPLPVQGGLQSKRFEPVGPCLLILSSDICITSSRSDHDTASQ
jgi:hypothetical protein